MGVSIIYAYIWAWAMDELIVPVPRAAILSGILLPENKRVSLLAKFNLTQCAHTEQHHVLAH